MIKTFTFPDGQPHLLTDEKEVNVRITNPNDLFNVMLMRGCGVERLNVFYLMGGRMDRRIAMDVDGKSYVGPDTLFRVCSVLRWFEEVNVLSPHSYKTLEYCNGESMLLEEHTFFAWAMDNFAKYGHYAIVMPDEGARKRYDNLTRFPINFIKERDLGTGRIIKHDLVEDGFYNKHIRSGVKNALIVDDLCDGGATFIGIADNLRSRGFERIGLAVPHGIFSKGKIPLDNIYTTNSYRENQPDFCEVYKFDIWSQSN